MKALKTVIITLGLLCGGWFALPVSVQTTIANNASDMSGKIVMVADSATPRTVTNLFTFNRGTTNPPFAVGNAGATTVANLDADKVDGFDSVRFRTIVVTTTATGTQNNFDPSGTIALGYQITYIRCNNATDLTVTGLPAGVFDGQIVIFYDIGSANVLFQDASGGSGSSVELQNIATSAATPISLRGFARYSYDSTTGIWRLQSHDQGAPISFSPTFGGGTSESGQVYSVQVGNYVLRGRVLHFSGNLTLSTLGTITGNVRVKGLPFTLLNSNQGGFNVHYFANMTTNTSWLSGFGVGGTSQIELTWLTAVGTSVGGLAQANMAATTAMYFDGTVEVQ